MPPAFTHRHAPVLAKVLLQIKALDHRIPTPVALLVALSGFPPMNRRVMPPARLLFADHYQSLLSEDGFR